MSRPGRVGPGHVFISYVHDDEALVERLAAELTAGGVEVWRDKDRLTLGENWEMSVRKAIEDGTFFIACFSERSAMREKSYMNEEISVAVDELRKRPRDSAWFISVLLSPDALPEVSIDAGRTLRSLYYLKLYEDWEGGVRHLIAEITGRRQPEKRRALTSERSDLKRPVSATYLSRRDLLESAVDATLGMASQSTPRDEISSFWQTGAVLPASLLYASPSGAENWVEWCKDPVNRDYHEAVLFWGGSTGRKVARSIADRLGRRDFDYVSLGPGDGRKDAHLLSHWLDAGAEITYYPFDASMPLLPRAIRHVLRRAAPMARDRLYVKAVLADFSHLDAMSMVFDQRSSPNVVAAFGNSIGALGDELELLRDIGARMSAEDLLVLEVPLQTGGRSEDWVGMSAESAFYFGPLASLGVPFDPGKMSFTTVQDASAIPGTTTVVVSYGDVALDGQRHKDIRLAHVHRYTEGGFLEALTGSGFEVLSADTEGGAGGCLACVARLERVTPSIGLLQ